MVKSTPRKLRNKPVLEVLQKHDYSVKDTADELNVTATAVYSWLKRNNCQRVFVYTDSQER